MELWLPRYAEQAGAGASSSLPSPRHRSALPKPCVATAVMCFPLLSPGRALQSLERLSLSSAPSKIFYEMSNLPLARRGMPFSQSNRMASNLVSVQVEYYWQPKVPPMSRRLIRSLALAFLACHVAISQTKPSGDFQIQAPADTPGQAAPAKPQIA